MKEIWLRLISATPLFFKKVQGVALSLSALGGALQAIENVPPVIDNTAETFIWLGAVIAAVAQFAVSNTSKHIRNVNVK